ncbi:MAG: transferrin-binding protein-like solute binding protein [Pseudomonadota bacterium]
MTPLDYQGTHAGSYDLVGRVISTPSNGASSTHILTPGEASFLVAKQSDVLNFKLDAPGIMPTGGIAFPSPVRFWSPTLSDPSQFYEDDKSGTWPQYLGQRLSFYRIHIDGSEELAGYSDFQRGTSTSAVTGTTSMLTYNIGNAYVAMGEWASSVVTPGVAPSTDLLFVNGNRTPPSGIPVSGTATYDAHTLSLLAPYYDSADPGLYFTLTADFGLRTIATRIDQDYRHYDDDFIYGEPAISTAAILGIHVGGSSTFSNEGYFDILLSGTVNYSATNAVATPPSEPVTGSMNGAFFGPHAEEIGGTFSLDRAAGAPIKDTFIGHQQP